MNRAPLPPPAADEPHGWRRLAWNAYERLPRSADVLLRIGARMLLPLANRRVSLTMVEVVFSGLFALVG